MKLVSFAVQGRSTFGMVVGEGVVVIGTPGGTDHMRKLPLFMKAGDNVEVSISGIGCLTNRIVDEGE